MIQSGKASRKGLSRFSSQRFRQPRKPVNLIVEGKNTEPAYFDWLKKIGLIRDDLNLKIEKSGEATSAKNLLTRAERVRKNNPGALICIVLDQDRNSSETLQALRIWQAQHPIQTRVAISIPKFEIFLIMHFRAVDGLNTPEAIDAAMEIIQPEYKRQKLPKMSGCGVENVYQAIKAASLMSNQLPERNASDLAQLVEFLIKKDLKE